MNPTLALSLALAAVTVAALVLSRSAQGVPLAPGGGEGGGFLSGLDELASDFAGAISEAVTGLSSGAAGELAAWLARAERPENANVIAELRSAEERHGIPPDMLVRLAWQESRYRINAHNASSDASGIMQIVPKWHPDVDPFNAPQAIDYGARFLASLHRQFGSWELALKAYNWGPGNVRSWLRAGRPADREPAETREYSRSILDDLAAAGRGVFG